MAQSNQPVQVRMKLSGEYRMTITPYGDHTVDEVLKKLENRTAEIRNSDMEIIEPRGARPEEQKALAHVDVIEDHTLRTHWMR